MPNRTRIPIKLLVLVLVALPLALLAQNLSATEQKVPSPAVQQPQDLTAFLGSLSKEPLPDGASFTPAPENRVIYCSYQGCPAGQRCLNCNGNWVCIYIYPNDPDRVPSGCSGGPV